MKILCKNSFVLLWTVCFGLVLTSESQAKVCFVGDDDCAQGAEFEEYTPPATENLCTQEGYNKNATDCLTEGGNIGGVCPYDASFVKCCGAEYAYQACVFPLENVSKGNGVDKCGSLYKCQCNEEYKTPAEWGDSASSACQPGGGVCILSTDTTVRYNKCICDVNYFPYEGTECPDDMVKVEGCTDSDGKSRVSCQCPSGYRTCTYGPAPNAKSCKQGGLILYNSCKSAEDECENAGYFKDCHTQICYHDTNSTEKVDGDYPTNCEDSYEACPYAYGFYKCRWSAENYCAKWDMTEYSKQLPSTCTKDGVQGTVIPCNLGGSYNGGGNTKNYLGYYRCKLTCEQQVRGAVSQGYLTVNNNIVDSKGNYGFVRTDSSGKHLYLTGNVSLPKVRTSNGNFGWDNNNMAKESYVSVNGINALYDIDDKRYSSCSENRTESNRPTITINHDMVGASNRILDVDLHDINIDFYLSANKDASAEYYELTKNHTWSNIRLRDTGPHPKEGNVGTYMGQRYIGNDGDWTRSKIHLNSKVTLTMTGDLDFEDWGWCFSDYHDEYDSSCGGCTSWVQFHTDSKAMVYFKDADIYTSHYWDWDGAANATMLFENSSGNMGKVWSHWNIGFLNSDIKFKMIRTYGWFADNAKRSFGGSFSTSNDNMRETAGIYVGKNSTVTVTDYWVYLTGQRARLYIAPGSTFKTYWPFDNDGDDEVICIPDYNSSKFTACNGGSNNGCYTNGSNATLNQDSQYTFSRFFLYRGSGGGKTCFPQYGKCQDRYGWNTVKQNRFKGGSSGSKNWTNIGTSGKNPTWLMSGCGYPEKYGLGYDY